MRLEVLEVIKSLGVHIPGGFVKTEPRTTARIKLIGDQPSNGELQCIGVSLDLSYDTPGEYEVLLTADNIAKWREMGLIDDNLAQKLTDIIAPCQCGCNCSN